MVTWVWSSPQVRAASVFALGTYIMNVPEDGQSDLSISIDHSVGMRLLSLVNDGSPIVRRVSQGQFLGMLIPACLYQIIVLGNLQCPNSHLTTNAIQA